MRLKNTQYRQRSAFTLSGIAVVGYSVTEHLVYDDKFDSEMTVNNQVQPNPNNTLEQHIFCLVWS